MDMRLLPLAPTDCYQAGAPRLMLVASTRQPLYPSQDCGCIDLFHL